MSAAALGMLLCAVFAPAVDAASADTLPAGAPPHSYLRKAPGASMLTKRTVDLAEIRRRTDDLGYVFIDAEAEIRAAQGRTGPVPATSANAPVDASLIELLARLHYAFASDLRVRSERASEGERGVLLRNWDACARAKLLLTLGREWRGFVYADVGAADSAVKWQGLAGIRGDHGVDLLGGWRHVTYHFGPGRGLDSLDFDGPFLGATLAW